MRGRKPSSHGFLRFFFRKKASREGKDIGAIVVPGGRNQIKLLAVRVGLFPGRLSVIDNGAHPFNAIRRKCFALPRPSDDDTPAPRRVFRDFARCCLYKNRVVIIHVEDIRTHVFDFVPKRLYIWFQNLFQEKSSMVSREVDLHTVISTFLCAPLLGVRVLSMYVCTPSHCRTTPRPSRVSRPPRVSFRDRLSLRTAIPEYPMIRAALP